MLLRGAQARCDARPRDAVRLAGRPWRRQAEMARAARDRRRHADDADAQDHQGRARQARDKRGYIMKSLGLGVAMALAIAGGAAADNLRVGFLGTLSGPGGLI